MTHKIWSLNRPPSELHSHSHASRILLQLNHSRPPTISKSLPAHAYITPNFTLHAPSPASLPAVLSHPLSHSSAPSTASTPHAHNRRRSSTSPTNSNSDYDPQLLWTPQRSPHKSPHPRTSHIKATCRTSLEPTTQQHTTPNYC